MINLRVLKVSRCQGSCGATSPSDQQCCYFSDVSRFPLLLQFLIKAERAAHHRHGL